MYATQQNLIDRFGQDEVQQLSDRVGSGLIDDNIVDQALSDASDLIDGYVGVRYALPLATTPAILTRICCDLARANLYDDAPTDAVANNRDQAISQLKDISSGKLSLGEAAATESQPAGTAEYSAPDRTFNADNLADF